MVPDLIWSPRNFGPEKFWSWGAKFLGNPISLDQMSWVPFKSGFISVIARNCNLM